MKQRDALIVNKLAKKIRAITTPPQGKVYIDLLFPKTSSNDMNAQLWFRDSGKGSRAYILELNQALEREGYESRARYSPGSNPVVLNLELTKKRRYSEVSAQREDEVQGRFIDHFLRRRC